MQFKITKVLFVALCTSVSGWVCGQEPLPPINFADFSEHGSDAPAVFLMNRAKTQIFHSDSRGWYARTNYQFRLRVLNKDGLDFANVDVDLYQGDTKVERIKEIKATTYNINSEKGLIDEVHLQKDAIFTKQESERWKEASFTLPQVGVNSVIDVEYVKETPFIFNLDDWYFQHDIPVVLSRYDMVIPAFHQYVFGLNGYLEVDTSAAEWDRMKFEFGNYTYQNLEAFWEMRNVPAFREESFMTTREDYISKLEFQLQAIVTPNRKDTYLQSWEEVTDDMKEDHRFKSFYRRKDKFEGLPTGGGGELARAEALYRYFKSQFKWNKKFGVFPDVNINRFTKEREGNTSALGLAMYNLMKQQGLNVKPVLFSPYFNGRINYDYPFSTKLICTAVKLEAEDKTYLLDPVSDMPFGYLNREFLLGDGLVLGDSVEWIDMHLNGTEGIMGTANVSISEDEIKAEVSNTLSDFAISKASLDDLEGMLNTEWELDSMRLREKTPTKVAVDYYLKQELFDDLVLVPLVYDDLLVTENPFRAEQRLYPVDFYCKKKFAYTFKLDIGEDYEIESLPESTFVRTNHIHTYFNVHHSGGRYIQVSLVHRLRSAAIPPEEYPALRKAYSLLASLKEQVILLKRKT